MGPHPSHSQWDPIPLWAGMGPFPAMGIRDRIGKSACFYIPGNANSQSNEQAEQR